MCATTPSLWGARESTQGFLNATQAPYQVDYIAGPLLASWLKSGKEGALSESGPQRLQWDSARILTVFSSMCECMQCYALTPQQPQRNPATRHIGQLFQSCPTWHDSACSYNTGFSSHSHPPTRERVHAEMTSLCHSLSKPKEHRAPPHPSNSFLVCKSYSAPLMFVVDLEMIWTWVLDLL